MIDVLGLSDKRVTLGVFNRGHTEEGSLPTVTIGVTRAADAKW